MTELGTKTRVPRDQNVRVRLNQEERDLLDAMMRQDCISTEATFIRSLLLKESRRRSLLKDGGS